VTDAPIGPAPWGPPIDPRIRERLAAVKREAERRRLRWLVGIAAAVAVVALGLGITRSPLLGVHHVRVSGATRTSQTAIIEAAGLSHHPLMVDLDTPRMVRGVEALPWIATVHASRHWPGRVDIDVTERVPVAQVAAPGGQLALVDRGGRVLEAGTGASGVLASLGAGGSPPLPSIQIKGTIPPPASSLALPGSADALALAAALQPGLGVSEASLVTAVVADPGRLRLTLRGDITVLFGSADQLDAKVLALRTMLDRVNLAKVAVIDVRVPDAPVLTHVGQGSTVSTTPRG